MATSALEQSRLRSIPTRAVMVVLVAAITLALIGAAYFASETPGPAISGETFSPEKVRTLNSGSVVENRGPEYIRTVGSR